MPLAAVIPYVALAAEAYFQHRANKNKEKQAKQNYENDPRTHIRQALAQALFKDYPQLNQYPGLLDALMREPDFHNPGAGTSAIGSFLANAGKQYISTHPTGGRTSSTAPPTSATGFSASEDPTASACPPGQVNIPSYGCV